MYTWNLKDFPSHLFAASSMEGTHFYIWEKHLRTQNRSVTLKKKKITFIDGDGALFQLRDAGEQPLIFGGQYFEGAEQGNHDAPAHLS